MQTIQFEYGYKRTVPLSPDQAEARVREELAKEGFGVLTEIDVRTTLKNKLDVEFRPYKILGACNPQIAHRALSQETDLGLLLPCNVVVYDAPDEGGAVVAALDPIKQLGMTGRDDLNELSTEVADRLQRAIDAV